MSEATINTKEEKKDEMIFNAQGQLTSENVEDNVVIHTMPKKYFVSQPAAKKAKNLGFVILIGGALFLIAGFALMFYFIKNGSIGQPVEEETALVDETGLAPKSATGTKTALTDEKKVNESADNSGSLNDEIENNNLATSTENKPANIANDENLVASNTIINDQQPAASTETVKLIPAIDSDADGLTDSEESLLNTNINSQDTDGDGYTDLGEFLNMYNPAGSGKLIINPGIEKYSNSEFRYSLYYIKSWPVETVGGDDSVVFKLDNSQFIQIVVDQNSSHDTLEKWYKDKMMVDYINSTQYANKEGWEAIKTNDGLTFYLKKSNSDRIYILSYNLGTNSTLYYKGIFEMMLKSFETAN